MRSGPPKREAICDADNRAGAKGTLWGVNDSIKSHRHGAADLEISLQGFSFALV